MIHNVSLLSWKNWVDLLHLSKHSLSHGTVERFVIVLFVDIYHDVAGLFEWRIDKKLNILSILIT